MVPIKLNIWLSSDSGIIFPRIGTLEIEIYSAFEYSVSYLWNSFSLFLSRKLLHVFQYQAPTSLPHIQIMFSSPLLLLGTIPKASKYFKAEAEARQHKKTWGRPIKTHVRARRHLWEGVSNNGWSKQKEESEGRRQTVTRLPRDSLRRATQTSTKRNKEEKRSPTCRSQSIRKPVKK